MKLAHRILNYYRNARIRALGNVPKWVKVPRGFWMLIEPSESMDRAYYLGVYERGMIAVLDLLVQRGDTAVDIGTHKGYVTCNLAHLVGPRGKVVSVDADPRVYQELVANCERNGYSWVKPFNCAVGSVATTWDFYLSKDLGNSSRFPNEIAKDRVRSVIKVPVRPLTEILAEADVSSVDFVKIDAEGSEPIVLIGMESVLAKYRPAVFLEINIGSLEAASSSSREIEVRMIALGYKMLVVEWAPVRGLRLINSKSLSEISSNCFEVLFFHPENANWPKIERLLKPMRTS